MLKLDQHAALPLPSRDQEARQDFVHDFRRALATMRDGIHGLYQNKVAPAFQIEHDHEPRDHHDVRRAMTANPLYQLWSASQRFSQELVWESVIDTVEAVGVPDCDNDSPLGTLKLDPQLDIPAYHSAQDIHLMPGGYHGRAIQDEAATGAVYDLGVRIWGTGGMGPQNDVLGVIASNYFATTHPELKPKRILDMGCTIGASSIPWKRKFPDSEVFAIDVAAPCLVYGHRRAEALGEAIHFEQQNAEKTNYEDESFDVVVSHIMLHETSRQALPRIFAEAYRLLKPGGVTLHFDASPVSGENHFEDFMYEWEVRNNNEAFLGNLRSLDIPALMIEGGFDADCVSMIWAPGPSAEDLAEKGYVAFPAAPAFVGEKRS